jgi:antitoxin PrlF
LNAVISETSTLSPLHYFVINLQGIDKYKNTYHNADTLTPNMKDCVMASSYNGSITTVGNASEAIRLDKNFFRQNPEFKQKSKVKAQVIGPGTVLLSVEDEIQAAGQDSDPIAGAFLAFLAKDMLNHPERLQSVSDEEVQRVKDLVAGVTVSDDDVIPEDVTF